MKFSFLVLGFLVFVISVLMLTACPGNNLSTDANLKELSLAGELISGFDPLTYEYNVQLPAGTSEIPEITYIKNHPHQKIVVNLPASLPGIATVIVIAEDNTTMKAYRIVFSLAPSSNAYLRTLEYNGQSVPGFSKEKTEYEIFLPGGSFEVPEIVAIPELPNSTVVITKPNSLPGIVKIEVIAEDGVTKKLYSINFQLMASNDASLKSLKYDGMDVPGFDKDKTTYLVVLPEGTSQVPLVSAVASDPKASIKITQAVSLPGTATVQVTAEDGVTKRVYTVEFVTALSDDATLKSLTYNGVSVPGFSGGKTSYSVMLPYGTTSVTVSAQANHANATVSIQPSGTVSVPSSGSITVSIIVTAEDGETTKTYTIEFSREAPSNDATLKSLSVSPGTLTPAFSSSNLNYSVEVPYGTSVSSVSISAVTNHSGATMVVVKPKVLPGKGEVIVTAQDGVTKRIYSIDFTVAEKKGKILIEDTSISSGTSDFIKVIGSDLGSITSFQLVLRYDVRYITDWDSANVMLYFNGNPLRVTEKVIDGNYGYIYIGVSGIEDTVTASKELMWIRITAGSTKATTNIVFSSCTLAGGDLVTTRTIPDQSLDLSDSGVIQIK